MQQNYNKKRKLNKLKASLLMLMMVLFAMPAMAQVNTGDNYQVYMKEGNSVVANNAAAVHFYDDHGPSHASDGNTNYWDRWYVTDKHYTYVFRPKTAGDKIKVTFKKFHAYNWSDTHPNNCVEIGQYSLRINDDVLKVYNSDGAVAGNLIAELTGTIVDEFTFMADGPMTFEFISNSQYREEGWEAEVTAVSSLSVQAPIISRSTCSNDIIITPTVPGATIYYTYGSGTTPDNPTTSSTQYTAPFEWPEGWSLNVKAIAVLGNEISAVTTKTFVDPDDRLPETILAPTIAAVEGTNTVRLTCPAVPSNMNETFYIAYTTDNTEPSYNNGQKVFFVIGSSYNYPTSEGITVHTSTYEFDVTTPGTVVRAKTFAYSCSNLVSNEGAPVTILSVYVDAPTISFETTNTSTGAGTCTIGDIMTGATVYYTTDGSTPTTSSTPYTGPFNVTAGQTIKAIAHIAGDGYLDSPVVSDTYIPGGNGQSGAYGSVVVLDDREPHSWTYYSDSNSPIHSLNPADVKITYFGYGNNTMTTTNTDNMPANSAFNGNVTADQVAVNVGEAGNQFIYMKTLENANEDGSGNYPYTMIHNPFQVRPVYGSSTFNYSQNFESGNDWTFVQGSTNYWTRGTAAHSEGNYGLYITNGSTNNNYSYNNYTTGTEAVSYAYKEFSFEAGTYTINYDWRAYGERSSYGNTIYDYLRVVLAPASANLSANALYNNLTYNNVPSGWTALDGGALYNSSSWGNNSRQFTINSAGTYKVIFVWRNDSSSGTQPPAAIDNISITEGGSSSADYRGFYAWRVKSLGGGLSISGKAVGDIIYPDETIEFVTSNAEGNEVEFEALWAKAWVNESSTSNRATNSGNYQNAYERNFKTSFSSYGYPVTISSLTPDGLGTVSSFSPGTISCSADTKLENMTLSADGLNGNNHSLHIGRGVSNGNNNVTSSVYGYENPSGAINGFTLRIESGRYTNAYLFYYSSARQVTSSYNWRMILGSDYDRAKGDNSKLVIAGPVEVSYMVSSSSTSAKINFIGLSGTFGANSDNNELYMGYENRSDDNTAATPRFLEVLGGNYLGGVSGGIENGVTATTHVLTMRIKGGTFHQYVYGAGQYSAAIGTRKTIITGGTFDAWVAGGCYGTDSNGNAGNTDGNSYVYFGGDANMTNTEGVFGGGYGRGDAGNNKYTINKSFVVAADEASIAGNVYGGGNKGYNTDDAEVYVLGVKSKENALLNIAGSVFGGANQARSEAKTTVTMKDGTVTGSLYGGANASGAVAGLATVNVSGGTVSNIYGGGLGSSTSMSAGTKVNVSGGTINNNVYGGSALGTVTAGNTEVNVSGGTMKDVFGAGQGGTTTALVSGQTFVNVTGGTMDNVYGGGENGDVDVAGGGGSSTGGGTEDFNNTTTAAWNAGTSYIPDGWNRYVQNSDYAYVPRVSNYSSYNYLLNNDGNYLLFSARTNRNGNTVGSSYAIMPKYEDIETVSFKYRFRDASYGQLVVGYVTNNTGYNTFTALQTVTRTAQWATVNLTESQINTINSNNGYIAFRFYGTNNTNNPMYSAAIDDVVVTVAAPSTPAEAPELASKVTIDGTGVTVNQDVYGGGKNGTTAGSVVVNLFKGNIKGHLFGGALGAQGSVFVGGQKTVNMTGGHVFGNVYGGSRDANDALALTGYNTSEQATTCEINISAGKVDQNVYGAGYYGRTYGSVNVYIGAEAISSAPNHTELDESINYTREGGLNIEGYIYAGSDWGDFTGGSFNAPSISGQSNVYVDGSGYNSTSNSTSAENYMKAGSTILGCGTSGDAGSTGRTLIVRKYGTAVADPGNTANPYSTASRQLYSIQRFNNVVFDNSHLLFTGQGKVNSLNVTEKYGLYETETVYLSNGSTFVTNVPSSQIKSFQSVTCSDVYSTDDNTGVWNASFTPVAINGLGATGSATDNKIRVNGGSYIEVKYEGTGITKPYGELKGWAHMMSSTNSQESTCAYARPKQSQETGNMIPDGENNGNDGGFVSYDGIYNQYTADGALVSTGNQAQIRYENHTPDMTKGDSQYFRIWRYGGNRSNIELVFDAHATGTEGYRTVDVTVTLPPFRSGEHYYRFETTGEAPNRNTTTDYGSDVLTFNMAAYNVTLDSDGVHGTPANNGYMYYQNGQQLQQTAAACPGKTDIDNNPDVNFGLVIMPDNTTAVAGSNYIICDASDNYLAELNKPFTCRDNTQAPSFTFRLTYNNKLSSNMTWDPMLVTLVQCDKDGNITDYVTLEMVVVTSTAIEQNYHTNVYAIMDGQGSLKDTYTAKLILPTFNVNQAGANSSFRVKSVSFTPDVFIGTANNSQVSYIPISSDGENFNVNNFGLAIDASDTYDNTNVWYSVGDRIDIADSPNGKEIGQNSGRNEVGIDVTLFYNSQPGVTIENESHMGTVTIAVEFDHYGSTGTGNLNLVVDVYRLGRGDNFYVDGVNGIDQTGYGRRPDKPAATVNYIFNRCNYRPGGNIFVVNTVTVSKPETWNGARFNSVNLYRYPGMHLRSDDTYGNADNNGPFTGKLVDVTNELTLRGIVMDGMYAEANLLIPDQTTHNQYIYPSEHGCNFNGQAVAPMINVADGGRVNLKDGVVLQNNYNTTASVTTTSNPGGALSVQYGGTARMNENAQITANINALGGGAWVDGALIVSDNIQIFGNKLNTTATSRQSNVWLTEATEDQAKANVHYKVIQVGTSSTSDEYGPLVTTGDKTAKVGVDKTDFAHTIDGFMPVVYAEDGTQLGTSDDYLEAPYQANQAVAGEGIIFHDANKYKLEKYTDDHYLFWISTWIQAQDHQPTDSEEDGGVAWDGIDNITTANQFAWLISLINGENGCDPNDFEGQTIIVKNDLDLKASIWVPITNFKGTLQGNGHVIQGLNSPLSKDNMGMFGNTDGATISDVIAKVDFSGDAENVGTLIGTMKNTTLSNVEAAGKLVGKTHTQNMGGLVGKVESGTIHSAFSVNEMTTSNTNTVMGGLIGTNGSDLYNSFANTTITGADNGNNKIGGLVGVNNGHVENCYAVVGSQTFPAFANTNNGVITICYADKANGYVTTTGEGTGVDLSGHGTYGTANNIKDLGYMYGDNLVTLEEDEENNYVADTITYKNGQIGTWPGLLSSLNQWVKAKNAGYSSWNRPLTQALNGDLPILAFPKDNCLGNLSSEDGKMLRYSASDKIENGVQANNGLDHLLGEVYNEKAANVYLYGSAINVTSGTGSNKLFIHEDAALLQDASSKATIDNATVGVTFDNSDHGQHASDYYGNKLDYDWHFMSTPLQEASTGATYTSGTFNNSSHVNIESMVGGYFPDSLITANNPAVGGDLKWDFYTYYEPEYHWINLKRGPRNHWHVDGGDAINYVEDDNTATGAKFIKGKGYMMAISQDSYLSNTGTLNNGDVEIMLTNQEPLTDTYNKGWNLVGNPYQAYLDLNMVGAGTYYIYDAESGVYVPYTVAGSDNPVTPSRYIHPHQGFFMYSANDSTNFTFSTTMATANKEAGSYFRGDDQVNYPLVNLFAKNQAGNRDLAIIEFNRPEIGGATKVSFMTNANFSIAAHLGNESYGLLFTPENTERVPVYFVATEDGTYTLDWSTHNGEFTSLLLVDNKTGVITDMLRSDHYTFEASADDYASRFYITYNCIGVDELGESDGFAYFDGSEWVINGQGNLDVVDMLGRTVYAKQLTNEQNRVNLNGVAKGVYLLRVNDGKNTMVQKIVVR